MLNQSKLLFQKKTDYGDIEIHDRHGFRCLDIDSIEQSRIQLDQPRLLVSALHRSILTSLLFTGIPDKVLLGGMGGGALARYLHVMRPAMQGHVVEIDETVAILAKRYFDFPTTQWSVHIEDFQNWRGDHYDAIIADIAEGEKTPSWLSTEKILSQLKHQLSENGVLTINLLVDDAKTFKQHLMMIRKIFEHRTLCLSVVDFKNIIVFAFNEKPDNISVTELTIRAEQLTQEWGFDLTSQLEQLLKDNPAGSGIL